MGKKLFDFDAEFRLGIEAVDGEHVRLVNMLNEVHELLGAGKKAEAQAFFSETLSAYVGEHFANEEKFMQSFGFPQLEDHRRVHENFKKSFQVLLPQIQQADEAAFRKALSDAFSWIITHIGKTDRKYAAYYFAQEQ
jgi:hemerythrin